MLKKSLLAGAALLFGAGVANAADVIDVAPVSDWTGFYVGIHGGYGWGNFDYNGVISADGGPAYADFGKDTDSDGFFAGLQAGFNWQMDSVVLGIEGDISKSWIDGNDTVRLDAGDLGFLHTRSDADVNVDSTLDWFGTLRARAGFLATPDLLIYATGGLAWGSVDTDVDVTFVNDPNLDLSSSDSTNHMGWSLGAGLEYKVSDAMSIKAEYLYIDLGKEDVLDSDINGNPIHVEQDVNVHTVRAGLNFHF